MNQLQWLPVGESSLARHGNKSFVKQCSESLNARFVSSSFTGANDGPRLEDKCSMQRYGCLLTGFDSLPRYLLS